jgi:hypothetical protein
MTLNPFTSNRFSVLVLLWNGKIWICFYGWNRYQIWDRPSRKKFIRFTPKKYFLPDHIRGINDFTFATIML